MTTRRQFLARGAGLAAATVAPPMLASCSDSSLSANRLARHTDIPAAKPGAPLPWINWARNEYCHPTRLAAIRSEEDMIRVFAETEGVVRPVGASHSFSPVVPTDDVLVSTDLLEGLIDSNLDEMEAEFWAGTRIYDAARQLASVNQAFPNLPDMAYPSLAGSIACSVHGTGHHYGSMSHYVTGLTLVTPQGEVVSCDETTNRDVFKAAQTSLGALGVVTRLKFKNIEPFDLTEVTKMADTNEVLSDIEKHFSAHRNFELFAFPLTSRCAVIETNYAKQEDANYGEESSVINDLRELYDLVADIPLVGHALYNRIFSGMEPNDGVVTHRTGPSYDVLTHIRLTRFREMEYTVPVEAGPACLKEILQTIAKKKLPINIPIEYRHTKEDDIWLSMFQGHAGASISIHQHETWDYKAAFAEIEPIFWKYNGRPHWGKIHTLSRKQLAALYPDHWQDFDEVRRKLDPQGRMLNTHLKSLFVS